MTHDETVRGGRGTMHFMWRSYSRLFKISMKYWESVSSPKSIANDCRIANDSSNYCVRVRERESPFRNVDPIFFWNLLLTVTCLCTYVCAHNLKASVIHSEEKESMRERFNRYNSVEIFTNAQIIGTSILLPINHLFLHSISRLLSLSCKFLMSISQTVYTMQSEIFFFFKFMFILCLVTFSLVVNCRRYHYYFSTHNKYKCFCSIY